MISANVALLAHLSGPFLTNAPFNLRTLWFKFHSTEAHKANQAMLRGANSANRANG